jgi:hypothetical protein
MVETWSEDTRTLKQLQGKRGKIRARGIASKDTVSLYLSAHISWHNRSVSLCRRVTLSGQTFILSTPLSQKSGLSSVSVSRDLQVQGIAV